VRKQRIKPSDITKAYQNISKSPHAQHNNSSNIQFNTKTNFPKTNYNPEAPEQQIHKEINKLTSNSEKRQFTEQSIYTN
jgi:hypothetical protein